MSTACREPHVTCDVGAADPRGRSRAQWPLCHRGGWLCWHGPALRGCHFFDPSVALLLLCQSVLSVRRAPRLCQALQRNTRHSHGPPRASRQEAGSGGDCKPCGCAPQHQMPWRKDSEETVLPDPAREGWGRTGDVTRIWRCRLAQMQGWWAGRGEVGTPKPHPDPPSAAKAPWGRQGDRSV